LKVKVAEDLMESDIEDHTFGPKNVCEGILPWSYVKSR